eukprot:TRINITY_DN14218_c0_g1_i1.p1 TRINITY_DN14218_c0_g1~~TRINITY_DN14218_c0_g1_i1.p1  ORF type:complete len:399 (+),score=142.65 TRINITY_DN14218_c0_g1_i1:47-1243(+)
MWLWGVSAEWVGFDQADAPGGDGFDVFVLTTNAGGYEGRRVAVDRQHLRDTLGGLFEDTARLLFEFLRIGLFHEEVEYRAYCFSLEKVARRDTEGGAPGEIKAVRRYISPNEACGFVAAKRRLRKVLDGAKAENLFDVDLNEDDLLELSPMSLTRVWDAVDAAYVLTDAYLSDPAPANAVVYDDAAPSLTTFQLLCDVVLWFARVLTSAEKCRHALRACRRSSAHALIDRVQHFAPLLHRRIEALALKPQYCATLRRFGLERLAAEAQESSHDDTGTSQTYALSTELEDAEGEEDMESLRPGGRQKVQLVAPADLHRVERERMAQQAKHAGISLEDLHGVCDPAAFLGEYCRLADAPGVPEQRTAPSGERWSKLQFMRAYLGTRQWDEAGGVAHFDAW